MNIYTTAEKFVFTIKHSKKLKKNFYAKFGLDIAKIGFKKLKKIKCSKYKL